MTKKNKYKVAPSASTRFIETIDTGDGPSKHYSNHITLTLLVCKTKKWDILRTLLSLDPEEFPRTLQSTAKVKGKHPLLLTDGFGYKCLDLILESGQLGLIKRMFELIDPMRLKSQLQDILQRLKNLCESEDDEYVQILLMVMDKTGLKYDKTRLGALICNHIVLDVTGRSCSFEFKPSLGLMKWKCSDCNVVVNTDETLKLEDNNHYFKHECKDKLSKVFNNMGEIELDKLRFQFSRDDSEIGDSDDEDAKEAVTGNWMCSKKKCEAKINVDDEHVVVDDTEEFLHSCKPCLKLEVHATLDDVKYNLLSSSCDETLKWKCQNCLLELETSTDFKLLKFYRKSMHNCISEQK